VAWVWQNQKEEGISGIARQNLKGVDNLAESWGGVKRREDKNCVGRVRQNDRVCAFICEENQNGEENFCGEVR